MYFNYSRCDYYSRSDNLRWYHTAQLTKLYFFWGEFKRRKHEAAERVAREHIQRVQAEQQAAPRKLRLSGDPTKQSGTRQLYALFLSLLDVVTQRRAAVLWVRVVMLLSTAPLLSGQL